MMRSPKPDRSRTRHHRVRPTKPSTHPPIHPILLPRGTDFHSPHSLEPHTVCYTHDRTQHTSPRQRYTPNRVPLI
ncbi:hypothetical protein N658DRAFT_203544 [Parathielavia hyrcaniae]|uniref:Uncharacterized protein n=1 Tax=Parathielavia hyrcaniae TaxID=113614 RepID=A0AAN6PW29_9PEZI|nr:hypothetical protein N658DRAFT_203544 [Parathielavia hyrcaniae]